MTIAEMHIAVKLGLDKSEGLQLPAFEPEEIDFWLNDAIERFVKTRYSGNNVWGKGFEQTQKRTDDLYTLVEEVELLPIIATDPGSKPNSYVVSTDSLPDDYKLFLNDEVTINFFHQVLGDPIYLRMATTECNSDNYSAAIADPYSEHRLHMNEAKPLRLFSARGIEIVSDGNYEISYYYLRYIRIPAVVNILSTPTVNCDLPGHTHSEVVEMTVNKLLENIEGQRYQTQTVELTKVE